MIARFIASAEAVGASIKRFSTLAAAMECIREYAADKLATTSHLPEEIRTSLRGLRFASPEQTDQADLGISIAQAGVAQTGSLLLDLATPSERSATALPPVHLVILRASTIVPDLYALHDTLRDALGSPQNAYLSLITGPSRTADIERVLTIGVHGPKELHILIVEGDQP